MSDLLILTTLDVLGRANNREHHAIRGLRPGFERMVVVYRRRGRPGRGPGALLRADLTTEVREGITYVGVDPVLNPVDRSFAPRRIEYGKPTPAKAVLRRAVDAAGILRDGATIRALATAALPHLQNPGTLCEAFGPWAALSGLRLRAKGALSKVVYVDRDFEPGFMKSKARAAWAARCERKAAAGADLTLSIGHRLAQRLASVPGVRLGLSPTGVESGIFGTDGRRTARNGFIFIGEVAPRNGLEEVLEALAVLRRSRGEAPGLVILGPAEARYRDALLQRSAELGLSDAVDWPGNVPREEVARRLSRAGIGLAVFRPDPLRVHAAPLKVLEYAASGLPILSLEGSEAGDLVIRTGTGLAVECTAGAIAGGMERLLADGGLYSRMSAAGADVARSHDWDEVLRREANLLSRLSDNSLDAADLVESFEW